MPTGPALDALIARHGLAPHPEGGFFAEVVRCGAVARSDGASRAALTAIHYVLPSGAASRWHRVDADEVWTHVGGDALDLWVMDEDGDGAVHRLGAGGDVLALVPSGAWQAARPGAGAAGYTHVVCTVAPGFEFADWHLAADAPTAVQACLERLAPGLL